MQFILVISSLLFITVVAIDTFQHRRSRSHK